MKLNAKAMAVATGVVWGGGLLLTGVAALALGGEGDYYGKDFLLMVASVYPGYRGVPEIGDVLLGTGIGLADGAVAGFILASIYNMCAGDSDSKA